MDGIGVPMSHREGYYWLNRAAEGGHMDAAILLSSLFLNGFTLPLMSQAAMLMSREHETFTAGSPDYEQALRWALKASQAGSAEADALVGFILITAPPPLGDAVTGARYYKTSAEAGCPQGALGHGLMLLRGNPGPEVSREALSFILHAHKAGLLSATVQLAGMIERGEGCEADIRAAMALWHKAAEAGSPVSQLRIGLAMIDGDGVSRDVRQGENYLVKAAESGLAEAAFRLAESSMRGNRHEPNYYIAARWYQKAAELGHVGAARALGYLYMSGAGVEKDDKAARYWIEFAANAGDSLAHTYIGNALLAGKDAPIEPARLVAWYTAAASKGDFAAVYNIGLCFLNGIGLPMDLARGAFWIQYASSRVPEAMFLFGQLLATGRGVPPDLVAARQKFREAADCGIVDACFVLGEMLDAGIGGSKDADAARVMFEKAASAGHVAAMHGLAIRLFNSGADGSLDAAFAWFLCAAKARHAPSILKVVECLATGTGCTVNQEEAVLWLNEAEKLHIKGTEDVAVMVKRGTI